MIKKIASPRGLCVYYGVLMMYEESIARKRSDGKLQSLQEHSKNVAEISASISHYPNTAKLTAYLHDLGKSSSAFQTYIKEGGERGSVIHAWQGAFWAKESFSDDEVTEKLLIEVMGLCITGHHNHLHDGVAPDGSTEYIDKFSHVYDEKYSYDDIKGKITNKQNLEFQYLFDQAKVEIKGLVIKIREVYKDKNSADFALGLFVKYLFSCLVDADRLDAYLFDINEKYSQKQTNWDGLLQIFENAISKYPATTQINFIRKSISEKCKSAADKESGIYQLSVPTGGGKTLSSLRFALHHSKKYHKKRIIYVIPYLSIIEQTAANLRDVLNLPKDSQVVFEHHSNLVEPEDEASAEIRKLIAARWDSPIIITTFVQFLESVMSSKSGKLRKFASMADSVIIFDEIQSVPIKTIHCFNEVVTYLSKIMNSTIILCSATQPTLESTQRKNLSIQKDVYLIDCREDFNDLERVSVSIENEKNWEEASDFILEKANENGNCLVIVNTKNSALEIFDLLKIKTSDFEVKHLSTSMYPAHRAAIISQVKSSLNNNEKIICVSTQLIEAGVDISFSCVVRTISGLDSIAQAAGRCNRNGESLTPKPVYIFSLKDENLDKLMDIKSGKEVTEQIIYNKKGDSDILKEETMKTFYQKYFAGKEVQMDYPAKDGGWVYKMLSGNAAGKGNYRNITGKDFPCFLSHGFHSADVNFSVIEKNTKTVIIDVGEASELIEKYRNLFGGNITREKVKILNELQRYSVSLYEWQLKKFSEQRALDLLDEETGAIVLNGSYYSDETGIMMDPTHDSYIV